MHEMSFWELVRNSPEWVAALAAVVFGCATAFIIGMQVRVMTRQERNSERNERNQIRLLRLQHEHDWMVRLNSERDKILQLSLSVNAGAVVMQNMSNLATWIKFREDLIELRLRLRSLDVAALTTMNNAWYSRLTDYMNALIVAVNYDATTAAQMGTPGEKPNPITLKAFAEAERLADVPKLFMSIELAIRSEFEDFNAKWKQFEIDSRGAE